MKVLQINSVYGVGSTGRIVADLAAKLHQADIDAYSAFGRGNIVDDEQNVFKMGTRLDQYVHGIFTRFFDKHALWGSENATRELVSWMESVAPDIIHLHNLHGYYLNMGILFEYLRRTKKPVIWTLHDCWSFTGHCAHFSYVGCKKWKTGCTQCIQKSSYPASFFWDNSQKNYFVKKELITQVNNITIVTPSIWLAELVRKSFLGKYAVKIIPNGIDIDIFKPVGRNLLRSQYGLENKFIVLGVASHWGEKKGLKEFIALAHLLSDDFRVVLVGLNDKQSKNLPANIIPLKKIDNMHELAQIYSDADVFVNLSAEETFGLVTIEAMACGVPAVVFESTPGQELVEESCGGVVGRGNLYDVKECIYRICAQGKDVYFNQCINQVKLKYNKEDRVNDYLLLYKSLGGCT